MYCSLAPPITCIISIHVFSRCFPSCTPYYLIMGQKNTIWLTNLGSSTPPPRANTRCSANVVLLLGQRRGRWPNSKTTLAEDIVFAGPAYQHHQGNCLRFPGSLRLYLWLNLASSPVLGCRVPLVLWYLHHSCLRQVVHVCVFLSTTGRGRGVNGTGPGSGHCMGSAALRSLCA